MGTTGAAVNELGAAIESPRARFGGAAVSGSAASGERARFTPAAISFPSASATSVFCPSEPPPLITSTSSSASPSFSPTARHGAEGASRTTTNAPEVPAQVLSGGMRRAQGPQMSASYAEPGRSAGGSPSSSEVVDDAAASSSSFSGRGSVDPAGGASRSGVEVEEDAEGEKSEVVGAEGDGSRDGGRSRKLRHDSWNQSCSTSKRQGCPYYAPIRGRTSHAMHWTIVSRSVRASYVREQRQKRPRKF